ncbi:hypothetical protein HBB16_13050 [Pseudonocardia sp. MCCB 268]|nr:hypothetical protein [Pseudonocardia cytotoxica]
MRCRVSSLSPGPRGPAVEHRADLPIADSRRRDRDPRPRHWERQTDEPGEILGAGPDQFTSGYWQKLEATGDDHRRRLAALRRRRATWTSTATSTSPTASRDSIVSGGENVYSGRDRAGAAEHPSVGDVGRHRRAAAGVRGPEGVRIAAEGTTVDPGGYALAHACEHLASFKCPKSVDVLGRTALQPDRSILKKDLRAPYWAGHQRRTVWKTRHHKT